MTNLKIGSGECPTVVAMRPRRVLAQWDRRQGRNRGGRFVLTGLLAVGLVIAPSLGQAENTASEVGREGGLGAAAALSSLIYGPAKLVYATGGLIVGSFAWIFTAGDSQVAKKVYTRSLRGTYVITPEILLGDERIEFIGRDPVEDGVPTMGAVAAAPPAATPGDETSTEYDELGW